MRLFGVRVRLPNFLLAVKIISLSTLGPILAVGHLNLTVAGGFVGCPFPLPLIMCRACPAPCLVGLISPWLFGGIVTISLLVGRIFCGLICPVGIISDFIFKLPIAKVYSKRIDQKLRYLKYGFLILFYYVAFEAVIVLLDLSPITGFWSFTSPYQEKIRLLSLIAALLFFIASICLYRSWCRYFCPIGTFLSMFNRFSVLSMKQDAEKCMACDVCRLSCPIDITVEDWSTSPDCFRCFSCYTKCERDAVRLRLKEVYRAIGR